MQTIGALTRDEISDFRGWLRDGIFAEVVDNSDGHIAEAPKVSALIALYVNDYSPADGEKWDVDAWEDRQGYIYAPATRQNWGWCFRLGRALVKGPCNIEGRDLLIELPSITTIH